MLAAKSGALVKFNSNKDIYSGITYKTTAVNVLNSKIITHEDIPFSTENVLQINPNRQPNHEQTHDHVFREFFLFHKCKIVYIGFVGQP